MTENDLVERLAKHRTLGAAPREELEWIATRGHVQRLAIGEQLAHTGMAVEGMYAILSGRFTIFLDKGGVPRKLADWQAGDVTGLLPYSRLVKSPGNSYAQEPCEIFILPREHMRAMTQECPELTAILVHRMVDRAREFTSNELHDEKLISLGRLSAGLAHELNNPSAAIERSAALLGERLDELETAARVICVAGLTDAQFDAVNGVRNACAMAPETGVRSPIQQAEHEEAIADWLDAHGLDPSSAEALADTAVTPQALDTLAGQVQGPALEAALRWAAAGCSVRRLASEIQESGTRIAGLVLAVKGFTHMDQATVAEPVNLTQSLGNTVAVLKAKARAKAIAVAVKIEPDLPRVRGFVGELNQIWGNLIDNALDAVKESGHVDVVAEKDTRRVLVRVVDDGPGIPAEIRDRIFDPFFTTKSAGQGTGLGLDIVRRLVQHNDGSIEVDSQPGRTEFRVSLLIAEDEVDRGPA
jgi:signal transduction histidine kinase